MLPHEVLHGARVDVAHRDDGHQIGPVPRCVEVLQAGDTELLNALDRADWQPVGIARAFEQDRKLGVLHARGGGPPQPPLLDHDAAFLVHLGRIERHPVRPLFEDEQRTIDHRRLVGRNLQRVDRLVVRRAGVHARTEPHAERLQEVADLLLGKVPCPVERHVLDEVRHAALIVGLEDRAGVDDQPKLGSADRLLVGANVVAQPVLEAADSHGRIRGQRRCEWRCGGRRRRRGILRRVGHRAGPGQSEDGGDGREPKRAQKRRIAGQSHPASLSPFERAASALGSWRLALALP
jgi:hypothetical protein